MDQSDLRRGLSDAAPLLPGVIPFGLVAGIAGVNAGIGFVATVAFSVFAFAGASQLAALELLSVDAPLAIVVLTATIVNLRLLMYSASIAPYIHDMSAKSKAIVAYLLTDMSYALSIVEFRGERSVDRRAYYLGAAVVPWAAWQAATAVGYLLGTGVPTTWQLDFAVPLVFLALLAPAIEDRAGVAAAVVGGGIAVGGAGLPMNLGLLVGAIFGICAGMGAATLGWNGDD